MFLSYPDIIILAGGFGTRLQSEVHDVPKPMAPVNGKPFLEYILNHIERQGFNRVILSTGYLGNIISEHFGKKFKTINLEYTHEKEPLGTGGAIKLASEKVHSPYFIIMNGDTFFPINLQLLFQTHVEHLANLTLALREAPDASRYGQVECITNGRITRFIEKSSEKKSGLINGGIYILNTKFFKRFEFPEKFSFERDFLEKQLDTYEFYGQVFNDYFLDIGIPEDYKRAQNELNAFID